MLGLLLYFPESSIAAVKAGSACTKLNSTSVSSGVKFTCIKSGSKLVWNKGVKVSTPTASPSAKPVTSVSPSSTPTIKPSVSPTTNETRRPQIITLPNLEKVEVGTETKLGIYTQGNSSYTLESQSINICAIIGIYVVSFKATGKCIVRVAVAESSAFLANSVIFEVNVVSKPSATPSPTPPTSGTSTTAPTPSATATRTTAPTPTPSATSSATATRTTAPTPTPSATPSATATRETAPTPTPSATPSATQTSSQNPLVISNTVLTLKAGTSTILTTNGGSGTGEITFSMSGPSCSISGNTLATVGDTTCVVVATKSASPGFAAVTSAPVSFIFTQELLITNTILSARIGTSITITSSGSRTTPTYEVSGSNCLLVGATLTAKVATTCVVKAKSNAISGYSAMISPAVSFVFKNISQVAILITSSSQTVLPTNSTFEIKFTGGSGTGKPEISVSGSNCVNGSFNSYLGVYATAAATCVVIVTIPASNGYEAASSPPVSFTFGTFNQLPLFVNGSQSLVVASEAILSTTGGSSYGAVTYSVINGNCTVSGNKLSALTIGTCVVTATKAAYSGYAAITSSPIQVDFKVLNQEFMYLFNNINSVPAGGTYNLYPSGGSGTGAVTYSVTGENCSITGNTLTSTSATTCVVVATKAASTFYNIVVTPPANYVFKVVSQASLVLSPQTVDANGQTPGGVTHNLSTTGGSGTGAVTYSVSGAGCSITANSVTANPQSGTSITCIVTATKAASLGYYAATSSGNFNFISYIAQEPFSIINLKWRYFLGEQIKLSTSGGSGTGAVSYRLSVNGICSLDTYYKTLTSQRAYNCSVIATKAGSGVYLPATAETVFTFAQF